MTLQQTYIDNSNANNRADFDKEAFDRLISEKGREVILRKALQCPCKSDTVNQLSTCKNCGGTGWIYVNPITTRMVLSGVDVSTKYAPWSEEARGTVAVTAMCEEELSYMDQITLVDGESVFSEVIVIKQAGSNLFAYTTYDISELLFVGLFVSDKEPIVQLDPAQYTIVDNIFRVVDSDIIKGSSITLRYKHRPSFVIIEFKRETIQSFKLDKSETLLNLPVSAFAKRLHYHVIARNLASDWLINNNFDISSNFSTQCSVRAKADCSFDFLLIQGNTFNYELSITEGQLYNTSIAGRSYEMNIYNASNVLIQQFTMPNEIQIMIPNVLVINKTNTSGIPIGSHHYRLQETNGLSVNTILFGNFIVQ
jgi:hypothetical protein